MERRQGQERALLMDQEVNNVSYYTKFRAMRKRSLKGTDTVSGEATMSNLLTGKVFPFRIDPFAEGA